MEQITLDVEQLRQLIRKVIEQVLAEQQGSTRCVHSGKPLTEKCLASYVAQGHREIILAQGAVATPLAKASARKQGIQITRQEG